MNDLHVTYGERSYSFGPGETVRIGRSPDNEIVVSDPTVSRQHAQISSGPDGWEFVSTGRALSFVNGAPVTRALVNEPTQLQLSSERGPILALTPVAAGPGAAGPGATVAAGGYPGTVRADYAGSDHAGSDYGGSDYGGAGAAEHAAGADVQGGWPLDADGDAGAAAVPAAPGSAPAPPDPWPAAGEWPAAPAAAPPAAGAAPDQPAGWPSADPAPSGDSWPSADAAPSADRWPSAESGASAEPWPSAEPAPSAELGASADRWPPAPSAPSAPSGEHAAPAADPWASPGYGQVGAHEAPAAPGAPGAASGASGAASGALGAEPDGQPGAEAASADRPDRTSVMDSLNLPAEPGAPASPGSSGYPGGAHAGGSPYGNGDQNPAGQYPGSPGTGDQNPGGQNLGGQDPGGQYLPEGQHRAGGQYPAGGEQSGSPYPGAEPYAGGDPYASGNPYPGGPGYPGGGPGYPGGGPGLPGGGLGHPGQAAPRIRPVQTPPVEEIATALHILVPIRSWLHDPGWRQFTRLLVIPYGLLPLIFIALFASSSNLATPGWAYSLYIAPLWAIVFWLLIRPGHVNRQEVLIAAGAIVFALIWIRIVTVNINGLLGPPGKPLSFLGAIGVGINEEITKALPILVAALLLLKIRSTKLDVRMWMFLGTIVGLAFGVTEQAGYTLQDIQAITSAQANSEAIVEVLAFAERVFVDGFQHALWAGVSAFFIGIAVNYPRRRFQLIALGIFVPAVLHGLYDWSAGAFGSLWAPILIQLLSLFLFLGYTMSAATIVRQVRTTPMFRGESMLMERINYKSGSGQGDSSQSGGYQGGAHQGGAHQGGAHQGGGHQGGGYDSGGYQGGGYQGGGYDSGGYQGGSQGGGYDSGGSQGGGYQGGGYQSGGSQGGGYQGGGSQGGGYQSGGYPGGDNQGSGTSADGYQGGAHQGSGYQGGGYQGGANQGGANQGGDS